MTIESHSSTLPPHTFAATATPIIFLVIPSPLDTRDWKFGTLATQSLLNQKLPVSVDLTKFMLPIRNQGQLPTCVAFAGSALREYIAKRDTNFQSYLSPNFIYLNRDPLVGGMYIRNMLRIIQKLGVPPENICQYNVVTTKSSILTDVWNIAKSFTILNYAQVNSLQECKLALNTFGPCAVVFPVYNFTYQFYKKIFPSDTFLGYHCVDIVGYDAVKGFMIRNSWGTAWGYAGFTWYPFSDWGAHTEMWTMCDLTLLAKIQKTGIIPVV